MLPQFVGEWIQTGGQSYTLHREQLQSEINDTNPKYSITQYQQLNVTKYIYSST